mgnify:CR=1 FL=1
MAKAEINLVRKEITGTVTLELSPEEAVVLTAILRQVGGTPNTTFRKYSDPIFQALSSIDYVVRSYDGCFTVKDGNIRMNSINQTLLEDVLQKLVPAK